MQSYFRFFDGWTYRLSNIFSCKQVWVEAWFKIWLNLRSILRSILRSNLWWILGSNWWSSLRMSPWSNLIWKAIEMRGALLTVTWGLQLGHCGFFIKSHEASINSLISCSLYFFEKIGRIPSFRILSFVRAHSKGFVGGVGQFFLIITLVYSIDILSLPVYSAPQGMWGSQLREVWTIFPRLVNSRRVRVGRLRASGEFSTLRLA